MGGRILEHAAARHSGLMDLGDWAGMKRTIYAIICVALIAAGSALLFSMSLDPPGEPFTSSKLQDG
ncbi:hypothetical protein MAXJ12_30217 [Mesorhizobium alhagi CCNWXJ12-2]|uniref:Uncharacterized protein n=1 Tax=Mesorhizobium alhagi CCNWXJ12-2 TaxID=1107882 RepID=H0I0Q6_9HYPH|nr:hypothetical protein MAXJ12_30217 [Mesorhizobium alhagi CCNWXJ12-2]